MQCMHDLIKVPDSEFGMVRPQIKEPAVPGGSRRLEVLSDGSQIDVEPDESNGQASRL